MRTSFTFVAAILALAFINGFNALAGEGKVNPLVMDGLIHSVDLKAGSFVLRGKKESQTTFRVGVKTGERRTDCLLLLDGKMANPETAIKPGRKATVTYVKVGDDLGASKLEITSAASAPAGEGKVKPRVMDGWIHSVDLKAKSFVLGGKNERQTKFRVAVNVEGPREAAQLLLDGQKATFEAAIQPKRKASVTYVKVSKDDLWVWKVAVTSAAK